MKYTNSIFIQHGMLSKGSKPISPRVLSLTVLIERSALLTCSFAAMVLHSTVGSIFLSFSNSLSINMVLTLKPALLYLQDLIQMLGKALGRPHGHVLIGDELDLICRDIVNRKAVPSTKNTSVAIVITLMDSTRE
jgi:hypothetical protein